MTTDKQHPCLPSRAIGECLALAAACGAYSVLSYLAKAADSVAFTHAHDIARLEQEMGLFVEAPINAWLSSHPFVASLAALQYSVSFLLMTGLALVALWIKAPHRYAQARWTLVIMTLGALATYWTYPLAPPRLVSEFGLVDSVAQHTSTYSQLFGTLANPYGAMPSMHTGWSIWVAVMLGACVWRSWWARALLALHPLLTIVTIIATGNHYVVDAIAGLCYFLLAWLIVHISTHYLPRKLRLSSETS